MRVYQTFGSESENTCIKQFIFTVHFDSQKYYFPEKKQDTKRTNEYV